MNKKEFLNSKGFTLVELLATVVLIALVSGIATYGVIGAINKSKAKSEQIFIDKLSNLIDDYLALNPPSKDTNTIEKTFTKCRDDNEICEDNYDVKAYKMQSIYISNLVKDNGNDKGIITYEELINPKNKMQCFDSSDDYNPEIIIYRDDEYVTYYYVNLASNKCELESGTVINTFHENLYEELKNAGVLS